MGGKSITRSRSGLVWNSGQNGCAAATGPVFGDHLAIMNIMVRDNYGVYSRVYELSLIVGITFRAHRDASGASAPAPALAGKGAARTRP